MPENSAAGTNVGAVIPEATDMDNDALTYSMEGTDATSFAFDASTRQITTIAGVDYNYEEKSSYSVTVKASDATESATVAVTIDLTDEAEQPDKPDKPTLAAVSGSHTSLAARWTKPGLNGGPEITGYRVEYREGTSGWVNVTHNGAGVTRTITGLTAGTEYQVRVRAINGETPSAFSDPSDAVSTNAPVAIPPGLEVTLQLSDDFPIEGSRVTVTATASPASPVAFTVAISATPVAPATADDFTLSTNRVLRFAADATESTGTVRIRTIHDPDPEPTDVVRVSGAVSNAAIPDPDDVTIEIINDDHEDLDVAVVAPPAVDEDAGAAVVTVTLTTRQNTAPMAYTDLDYRSKPGETATRGDDYTPPAGDDYGPTGVRFARVQPSAFSPNAAGTAWVAEPSFTIGIIDDQEAEVAETIVFAVGFAGDQTPAHTITIRDNDAIAPDRPTGLEAAPGSATEIQLSWTAPSAGSFSITGYRVEASENAGGPWSVVAADTRNTRPSWVHGGLSAGDTRHYRVSAISPAGTSGPSNVASATTIAAGETGTNAALPPPEDVNAEPQLPGEIRLSWWRNIDDPSHELVDRHEYRYRVRDAGTWTVDWTTVNQTMIPGTTEIRNYNSVLLKGLTARTTYEFRVRSVDEDDGTSAAVAVLGTATGRQTVWIQADVGSVAEGDPLPFTVSRDQSHGPMTAIMRIDETGDMLPQEGRASDGFWSQQVDFGPGNQSIPLILETVNDGDDSEPNSVVTVEVLRGPLYDVQPDLGPAKITVTAAAGGSSSGSVAEPLTAAFEGVPATHDGATAFSFRIAFSEAVAVTPEAMRTHVLDVAGGAVTGAARVDGESGAWKITVAPDSRDELSITLAPAADCEADGAVCTSDGRALSNGASHIVIGPADEPERNTAATGTPTIGGTPQVGEALTASTSGISDADGLDSASFAYQWIRTDTDIGGATGATYTPVAADEGAGLKVRVDFSDDAGNAESLVSAATEAVAAAPEPLTAAFEGMPEAHDGESAFRFRVAFSEDIGIGYRSMRDEAFTVSGGEVTGAKRVDGRHDRWRITVEPDSDSDVAITLPGGRECEVSGAICTRGGNPRQLGNSPSATVAGPAGLSVADAEADEAPGATMRFAVTLDRAAAGAATVDWATADGTARAGDDYAAAEGTLKFAPGERSKTVAVTVLDDSVDDAGETFRVLLSNASGARLADAEGVGTIRNADPLPRAWLARFGRTAADHAVDAIAERFDGRGGGDPHATFAGRRLWNGGGRAGADDDAFAPGWLFGPVPGDPFGAPGGGPGGSPRPDPGSGVGGSGRSFGTGAGVKAGMNSGPAGHGGIANGGMDRRAMRGPPAAGGYRPTLRDLLIRSSFRLSAGDDGGSRRLTGWGGATATRFNGVSDGVPVDGDVATFLVGADAAWNRWLAGISVAHSRGGGAFRGGARGTAGELDGTLTAVHPYLRYQATGRLSAWGVLGYGAGDLTLAADGSAWRTDTSMRMAAGGARGVFLRGGGLELAAKMDARLTRIASDAATGEAGLLGAAAGDTSRVRLLLEGSRTFAFGAGRRLTPTLELGVRRDGGDAETGAGVDLGGSLRYADAALGLTVDAGGRYLAAHEDDAYREWGASASIRLDPGTPGRGLTLSVMPSWGAAATGGAERLWSVRDARGLAGRGFDAAMRLRADIGYGLPAFRGKGAVTAFAGMSTMGRGDRDWRAGARWTRGAALRMSLEATRRETAGAPPAHGIAFRVAWRPGARGPARGAAGAAGAGDGPQLGAHCPVDGGEAAAVAPGPGAPPPNALACPRAPGPRREAPPDRR